MDSQQSKKARRARRLGLGRAVTIVNLLLLASALRASSRDAQVERASRLIPELMQKAGIPGLSAALLRNGRIVWTGAFGVRNGSTGDPVLEDTIFNAASLTKPVVAAAVLQMAARGEFDLDQPLWQKLPYPRLAHDPRAQRITPRMVLSHTTGLPNWGGSPLELIGDPGVQWGYSGEGFVYLAKVLEKHTGLALNELVKREVLAPLGMTESSLVWREDYQERLAQGHDSRSEVHEERRPEEANAAASLLTTATDYARFLSALTRGNTLLEETKTRMRTPVTRVARWGDASTHEHVQWTLGWGFQSGQRGPGLWHWGDNGDFRCYVLFYPEKGDGLVYFSNSENGLAIAEPVVSALFEDTHWPLRFLSYDRYDDPRRLARRLLQDTFLDDGAEPGLARLQQLRQEKQDIVDERLINGLGYFLLEKELLDGAVQVFRANVGWHPESANTYDSLGEALLTRGDLQAALENFQKAVERDSENSSFQSHLDWVRQLTATDDPMKWSEAELNRLTGRYGPRRVWMQDGRLHYERADSGREYLLQPLGRDTFRAEGLYTFLLRFVSDDSGNPVKLVGLYFNGSNDEFARDGGLEH